MPILTSVVATNILVNLDAEGSDRYLFDQDLKPAINYAVSTLVTWFNQAFAENKLTPENLRELNYTKVWKANSYSRVAFNEAEVGHGLWTLIGVYPKPVTNRSSVVVSGDTTNSVSKFMPDVSLISSGKSAKRLSQEEWNDNEDNAFMSGNSILSGSRLEEYAYLDFSNYSSTSYTSSVDKIEITIRPDVKNQMVAMAYLKYPNQVSATSDLIEFPKSLTELIVELACYKISTKQNNGTNLYGVTANNVNRLVSLMK